MSKHLAEPTWDTKQCETSRYNYYFRLGTIMQPSGRNYAVALHPGQGRHRARSRPSWARLHHGEWIIE